MKLNKSLLSLLIISIVACTQVSANTYYVHIEPTISKPWGTLNTVLAGAVTGALTGVAARITNEFWPLNWLLCWRFRKEILKSIVANAKNNNEYLDQLLLEDSAQICDWVAYIATKYHKMPRLCINEPIASLKYECHVR